jgi:hypothetical protein
VKPTGISSTWWVTSTVVGAFLSAATSESRPTSSSRAPRSSPPGRLVEQQQLRVGDDRSGELDPLAFALGQRAVGTAGEPADLERLEHVHRALVVLVTEVVARDSLGRAVARRPYDVQAGRVGGNWSLSSG